MISPDLKLLILVLIHLDPGMSGPDLVDKVARARNMKKESGRVYEWAYDLSNEVGRAKREMRDSGLISYGRGKSHAKTVHHLSDKGVELMNQFGAKLG